MKNSIALILCIMIIVMFCSCGQSGKVSELTIMMDDAMMLSIDKENFETKFRQAATYFLTNKGIALRFEYLSKDPIERQTQLSRVRTEMMAGDGPDIFILPTWETKLLMLDDGPQSRAEPLFKDIEDAMRNRFFLPLDEFIEENEYIDLDEHIKIVMDAGCTDEGQVLLPYTFEYGIYLFDKTKLVSENIDFDSFNDLLESQDNDLKLGLSFFSSDWIHSVFPNYVDYDNEMLTVTEAELADTLKDVSEIVAKTSDDWEGPFHDVTVGESLRELTLLKWNAVYDETLPVVIPNKDGGVTACITSFVAINRNTRYPEEAFNIIAPMFSEELQEINSNIWVEELERNIGYGIDECTDIGAQRGIVTNQSVYTKTNYSSCWKDLISIHNRITDVRFMSEMDCELYDVWNEMLSILKEGGIAEIDYNAIAAELYSDWKMMIAE